MLWSLATFRRKVRRCFSHFDTCGLHFLQQAEVRLNGAPPQTRLNFHLIYHVLHETRIRTSVLSLIRFVQTFLPLHNLSFIKVAVDSILASIGTSGCIREPETKSYARKNSHAASFGEHKMPNTTWKSYARKRNSAIHQ